MELKITKEYVGKAVFQELLQHIPRKKEVVYSKYFPTKGNHRISLRPFCISRDMPFLANALTKQYAAIDLTNTVCNSLAATYLYMASSDFARTYCCLLNNMPIGEIEICKADFTDLNIPVSQGDYYLKPLFYPGRKNNSMDRIMVEIMQTCIEYFFSFPEIKQLVSTANANDKESNELLLQCGFQFEEQIRTLYDLSNYYWCTRNSFRNSYTF